MYYVYSTTKNIKFQDKNFYYIIEILGYSMV